MEKSDQHSDKTPISNESDMPTPSIQKKSRASFLPWLFTSLIGLATVTVIVFAAVKKNEEPIPPEKKLTNVEVFTINTQEFIESLTLPAIIQADRVAQIKPEFSGVLKQWYFPEGSEVKAGAVIAEIDTESLRLSLAELEAALKTASENVKLSNIKKEGALVNLTNTQRNIKIQEIALASEESNLKLAKREFERIKQLAQKKLTSISTLDNAQNTLTQAELGVIRAKQNLNKERLNIQSSELAIKEASAGIELAEARIVELEASIDLLEYKIEKGKLRMPFSGRLEEHLAEPGEMVLPNEPIVMIYDLKFLRATVNVPDRYIGYLDPENKDAKAYIQMSTPGSEQRINAKLIIPSLPKLTGGIESGIELDAEIARIAQSSDSQSNTFKVELRFPNPGNALKHGVIGRGKIEYLYYPEAIIIPTKAVQATDEGPRVMVVEEVNGAQMAEVRDIKPVSIHGSKIFVKGGLKQGERLIVTGWKGLVGGEQVNVLVEDGKFIKPETDKNVDG